MSYHQHHLDAAAARERLAELRERTRQDTAHAQSHKPSSAAGRAVQPVLHLLARWQTLAEELGVSLSTTEQALAMEYAARQRGEARLLDTVGEQAERIHKLESEAAVLRETVRQYSEVVMPAPSEQQVIRVSGKLPYGYARAPGGAPVEEPEQAAAVRLIFALHQGGQSLRKIAAYLTEQAIGTPRDDSERWQASSVRQILKQRAIYAGETGYPALLGEQ